MIHNRGYGIRTYGPPQMAPPPTSAPLRLCTLRYLWRAPCLTQKANAPLPGCAITNRTASQAPPT
jgi:hypothetical protein